MSQSNVNRDKDRKKGRCSWYYQKGHISVNCPKFLGPLI